MSLGHRPVIVKRALNQSKQTVDTLIRLRSRASDLGRTVCLCQTQRTLGLHVLNYSDLQEIEQSRSTSGLIRDVRDKRHKHTNTDR